MVDPSSLQSRHTSFRPSLVQGRVWVDGWQPERPMGVGRQHGSRIRSQSNCRRTNFRGDVFRAVIEGTEEAGEGCTAHVQCLGLGVTSH